MVAMIRLLLVDDHAIVRAGYRSLLAKQPGLVIVGEAADGIDAYAQFKETEPDVVIMDLSLPGQSGLEVLARMRQRRADAKGLVFTMHQDPIYAIQATRAGALGYVTKSSAPEVLVQAIYQVHQGQRTLSADIAQALALEKLNGDRAALESLTVREFEILRLLVAAQSTEAIADALNISPKTVANCHYLIKRKLGVVNDIALFRWAIKMEIIQFSALS